MKGKILLRSVVVFLALLAVAGVALLILDESTSMTMTAYGIIAFSISIVSVTLAILTEVEIVRRDKMIEELTRKINEVDKEEEVSIDEEENNAAKINEILRIVEKMDRK